MPLSGRLFLLPVPLTSEATGLATLPPQLIQTTHHLRHFIAENPKSARLFLRAIAHPEQLHTLDIQTLSVQTQADHWPTLMAPLGHGHDVGLLSEAGCPAIADPGAGLVDLAHQRGIAVIPMVGPSSILLALMASGLNGQRFAFHGYLPVAEEARQFEILRLEAESARQRQTQLVIETPYRNTVVWSALCTTLQPTTQLTVARDLSGPREWIKTMPVSSWRTTTAPELQRIPTVFLWLAAPLAAPHQTQRTVDRNRFNASGKGASKNKAR